MTTATVPASTMNVKDLEVFADRLDLKRAAAIYAEHGALVVRGLMSKYVAELQRDIEQAANIEAAFGGVARDAGFRQANFAPQRQHALRRQTPEGGGASVERVDHFFEGAVHKHFVSDV